MTRAPHEISVWDILSVLEGSDRRPESNSGGTEGDVVYDVWCDLHTRSIDFLQSISLASLIERDQSREPVGNYSI